MAGTKRKTSKRSRPTRSERLSDAESDERLAKFRATQARVLTSLASAPGFRERLEARFEALRKRSLREARARMTKVKPLRSSAAGPTISSQFVRFPATWVPPDPSNPWSRAIWELILAQFLRQWAAEAAARGAPPEPEPTIYKLTQPEADPGDVIGIEGWKVDGNVIVQMADGTLVVATQVGVSGGTGGPGGSAVTYVEFRVPQPAGLWDAFDATVWVERPDGTVTNHVPLRIRTGTEYWRAFFTADLKSYFGNPGVLNGTAAYNAPLLPPPMNVLPCELIHSGDGWSELRAPMANGLELAQGFHIGNAWFEYSKIEIYFYVACRRGQPPPNTPGLSDWYGPFPSKPDYNRVLLESV